MIPSTVSLHTYCLTASLETLKSLAFVQDQPSFYRSACKGMIELGAPHDAERLRITPAESVGTEHVINMLDRNCRNLEINTKLVQDLICLRNDAATTEFVAWINGLLDYQRSCRQVRIFTLEVKPS